MEQRCRSLVAEILTTAHSFLPYSGGGGGGCPAAGLRNRFCIHSASTRRTTLDDRAFPVTAARAWNALPSSVRRSAPSLLQFRRDLKTALHVSVIVLFTIVSSRVTDCNF